MPTKRRNPTETPRPAARQSLSRRFTYRYLLALGLFGLLAMVAFWTVNSTLDRIDAKTRQLDRAATQADRVYRITDLARKLDEEGSRSNPDASRSAELAGSLKQENTQLRQIERGLLEGDSTLRLEATELSPRLRDVYQGAGQLDQKISDFTNAADQVVALQSPTKENAPNRQLQVERLAQLGDQLVPLMQKAGELYRDEVTAIVEAQRGTDALLLIGGFFTALAVAFLIFRPMALKIQSETTQLEAAEKIHRENNERQMFRSSLSQALEVTDSEEEVLAAVGRAMVEVVPYYPAELFLSDATKTHLRVAEVNPAMGGAGCPVEAHKGCAAIRRGQTQVFESSRMLNVCPKLPEHAGGACSAVCVPVMFSGEAIGVFHTTGPDNQPPNHTEIERLTVLAQEIGNRLGTLRVTQLTVLQASTDGLTGLLNRRSLESSVAGLLDNNTPFSVAIADLDHFKDLNDTYGHEAGDRALRLFAKVMKENLRPDDIPGRYGGEEFVVLLPETGITDAVAALERLQSALANEIERVSSMPFTASWGLTDHTAGTSFDEMLAVADAALYSAKRAGRNCIMVDGEAAGARPETPAAGDDGDQAAPPASDGLMEIDVDLLAAPSDRPGER